MNVKSLKIQTSLTFFNRIVNRFKKGGCYLDIMRQTVCLVLIQSWLRAMQHALVARRWFRPQCE